MKASAIAALLALASSNAATAANLTLQVVDAAGRPLRDAVVAASPLTAKNKSPRFAFGRVMGQRNIQFTPGTLVVPVGTTISFPNYDKVRHHVYSFSKVKKFELKLFGRDESRSVTLSTAGTVAVGCNIHDQMRGFIRVVDAPYAGVSDASGRVTFSDMPTGKVQLTVWHPRARARENEVRVLAVSGTAQVIRLPVGQ